MLKQTILVASQNNSLSSVMGECLVDAGYKVLRADQGRKALEIIRNLKPDLVLLDCMLSDLSGIALIRMIRSEENDPRLPIILMRMEDKEEYYMLGLEAGADICLTEPFQPNVFIARVRALLRRCHIYDPVI
jgi:DNA-binding response OmpR family regulator